MRFDAPSRRAARILLVDRETSARASAKADDEIGVLQLQAQVWSHYLERRSRHTPTPLHRTRGYSETMCQPSRTIPGGGVNA